MISNSSVILTPQDVLEIELIKKTNSQLLNKIHQYEHANLISVKKIQVLQSQIAKITKENHELIVTIDFQRGEKLKYVEKIEAINNRLNLGGAQTYKFEVQNKRLLQENEALTLQLQNYKLNNVNLLKQKQNACNKLLIAEAKLEALSMQETFINASLSQTASDNLRLKEEIELLNKKLKESNTGYVKTILKDSNQTKKQLTSQFQQKIYSKELANHEQVQRYEAKISQLNMRVAQLQSMLASK